METLLRLVERVLKKKMRASQSQFLKRSAEKKQKVLGMLWNHTQDELIYDLSKTLGVLMLNQRQDD